MIIIISSSSSGGTVIIMIIYIYIYIIYIYIYIIHKCMHEYIYMLCDFYWFVKRNKQNIWIHMARINLG